MPFDVASLRRVVAVLQKEPPALSFTDCVVFREFRDYWRKHVDHNNSTGTDPSERMLTFAREMLAAMEARVLAIKEMKASPQQVSKTIEDLVKPAWRVRRHLELRSPARMKVLAYFPKGCCQVASLLLLRFLTQECGQTDIELIANGEVPADLDGQGGGSHAWLEKSPFIIDIAADQFGTAYERVIVTDDRRWHDRFVGQTREHVSDDLCYMGPELDAEYAAMVMALTQGRG